MAKPILVANWKNHPGSLTEAKALLKKVSKDSRLYKKVSLYIAPPAAYFESVSQRVGSMANLASQDLPPVLSGTHTGLITTDILKSFGVRLAILGHSERRALGETDESVSKKLNIAISSGITPLVCIGERERDQDGEHFEFLRDELKASLSGLKKSLATRIIIAYEPIWAIGKSAKDAIQPDDLAQVVIFIRKILSDIFGRKIAESIPILYGGSVEPSGAYSLMRNTGVSGVLVGHASLDAKSFKSIAESIISK
jgi:triosephosphate isomerase